MHNYCTPHIIKENFEIFLIHRCNYILLSQVYCVWQVVKTPTIFSNNPVLSSHLCLVLTSGLFPLGFPTNTLYTPLLILQHIFKRVLERRGLNKVLVGAPEEKKLLGRYKSGCEQWRTEGGLGGSPPPEIPKFWQSWGEFSVPWKIYS
jgi:hypothetical protein